LNSLLKLFSDKSIIAKHREYLDKLQWEPSLGKCKTPFVPAKACSQRVGVLNADGTPDTTPERLFLDDSVYADIYNDDRVRIEQTVASGIRTNFILFGASDLDK